MEVRENNKWLGIASAVLPIIVVIAFAIYEISMVATGDAVSLSVSGYDPTDFLRGHYIMYDPLLSDIEIADPENQPAKAYESYSTNDGYILLIDSDSDGIYDLLGDFYWKKPSQPYLKAQCYFYGSDNRNARISLSNEQARFYLNENIAPQVEKEIWQSDGFEIVGTVNQGLFRAKYIEIDGKIYD